MTQKPCKLKQHVWQTDWTMLRKMIPVPSVWLTEYHSKMKQLQMTDWTMLHKMIPYRWQTEVLNNATAKQNNSGWQTHKATAKWKLLRMTYKINLLQNENNSGWQDWTMPLQNESNTGWQTEQCHNCKKKQLWKTGWTLPHKLKLYTGTEDRLKLTTDEYRQLMIEEHKNLLPEYLLVG